MHPKTLRIATRQSPLALWQANHIREALCKLWPNLNIELLPMTTSGDQFLKDKLLAVGGKGLFVKELEDALLDGRADLAVHSMKDVPALFPAGLKLTVIGKRHSPFDAFISPMYDNLDLLPKGAIIGTSSLRRQSQLLATRPDLQIKTLRGNINTRIDKLMRREYDAIILATAGLLRLEMGYLIKQTLTEEIMLPACGQGALGIECRADDEWIQTLLSPLNDEASAICVNTERRVNAQLGGNCHMPVAIYCTFDVSNPSTLILRANIASSDGQTIIRCTQSGLKTDAESLADKCAAELLNNGGDKLLSSLNHE